MSSAPRSPLAILARRWTSSSSARAETEAARRFWEVGAAEPENHYWGAQPLVRRAINRRVTGDPNVWPIDWFRAKFARSPLPIALSVGCGAGLLERDLVSKQICEEVEGVDFSAEAIAEARRQAEEAGFSRRIRYRIEDIQRLDPPPARYSAVFFHGSLHHVRSIERVLDRVRDGLAPGGLLYVDEYMGPARSEWTREEWSFARSAFRVLPAELKNREELAVPLPLDDPLESVRSSSIRREIQSRFRILEERPYGGNILWFVFPCLDMARLREDRTSALSRLIALEDHLLEKGWIGSYFRVIVARRE